MPTDSTFGIPTGEISTAEMPTVEILQWVLLKLQIFIGRPVVQVQLAALFGCLLLALFIARYASSHIEQALQWLHNYLPTPLHNSTHIIAIVTRTLTFPIAAILLTDLLRRTLAAQGTITGLLAQFNWIFTTILFFQCAIALLYLLFPASEVRRYHYRLFLPLLVLVLFLEALSNLVSLDDIAGVVLTTVFGNPLTLGAIFVATIGLYFWTDAVHGMQDLVYKLITRHSTADPGSTKAALTLLRYLLIIIGFLFALSQLQLDSTTLAAITGGLSVGIGFGLREILSNFVSGLLLLFERSLHPGDVIEVDGELSVVENFSIRATTVRTLNNIELVIPNQTFFTSSFKTYTGTDHNTRVPIILKTDCEIEPKAVMEVLRTAALAHKEVLREPVPSVFLLEYADNVATFQLNIWLNNPVSMPRVSSEVKMLVWDAFNEHDIALPFPETEVHFSNRQPLRLDRERHDIMPLATQNVAAD